MCEKGRVSGETWVLRRPSCLVNRGSVGLILRSSMTVPMVLCMRIRFSAGGGREVKAKKNEGKREVIRVRQEDGMGTGKEGNKVCKVTE